MFSNINYKSFFKSGKRVLGFFVGSVACFSNVYAYTIGEAPNQKHIEQSQIDNGSLSILDIIMHGRGLFAEDFNKMDGHGDTRRPGTNALGEETGFNRISGPDSVACIACHGKPFVGGGGDNVANIFPTFNRPNNVDLNSFEGLNIKIVKVFLVLVRNKD